MDDGGAAVRAWEPVVAVPDRLACRTLNWSAYADAAGADARGTVNLCHHDQHDHHRDDRDDETGNAAPARSVSADASVRKHHRPARPGKPIHI